MQLRNYGDPWQKSEELSKISLIYSDWLRWLSDYFFCTWIVTHKDTSLSCFLTIQSIVFIICCYLSWKKRRRHPPFFSDRSFGRRHESRFCLMYLLLSIACFWHKSFWIHEINNLSKLIYISSTCIFGTYTGLYWRKQPCTWSNLGITNQ